MHIKQLILKTHKLKLLKEFYGELLGLSISNEKLDSFTINLPQSELVFQQSDKIYKYHFCFLIPSNMVIQANEWLAKKTQLINYNGSSIVDMGKEWNAKSTYCMDAAGNIIELISRFDLNNDIEGDFNKDMIHSISEIGMAVDDIPKYVDTINSKVELKPYFGSIHRFYPVGDLNGLLLIVNKNIKKVWFPTELATQSSPFDMLIEEAGKQYHFTFHNEDLTIQTIGDLNKAS